MLLVLPQLVLLLMARMWEPLATHGSALSLEGHIWLNADDYGSFNGCKVAGRCPEEMGRLFDAPIRLYYTGSRTSSPALDLACPDPDSCAAVDEFRKDRGITAPLMLQSLPERGLDTNGTQAVWEAAWWIKDC